jgi:hypothetical protein
LQDERGGNRRVAADVNIGEHDTTVSFTANDGFVLQHSIRNLKITGKGNRASEKIQVLKNILKRKCQKWRT